MISRARHPPDRRYYINILLSSGKKTPLSSTGILSPKSILVNFLAPQSWLLLTFTALVRQKHREWIMPPELDEKAKEHLIICKNIRQATSKILQRPSYFQDCKNRSDQLNPMLGKIRKTEPARLISVQDSTLERNFQFAFRSNVTSNKSYSEYEYEFEKLHRTQQRNNCYEEIGEVRPYQPKRWEYL